MNKQKSKILFLIFAVALLAVPVFVAAKENEKLKQTEALANGAVERLAPAALAETTTNTYAGVVTIEEPFPLGTLDLFFQMSNEGGTLSGAVDAAKTQVFLGAPTFTGSVANGDDPTFQLDSEVFVDEISGRDVERSFSLVGQMLDQGDTLQGEYRELIVGFKAQPLEIKGTFLLARPSASNFDLDNPVPVFDTPTPTATAVPTEPGQGNPQVTPQAPTATATATSPAPVVPVTPVPPGNTDPDVPDPGGQNQENIYLPLISKDAAPSSASVNAASDAKSDVPAQRRENALYLPLVAN